MSGLIRISGGASTGGGGSANTTPVIKNFRSTNASSTTIVIRYVAEDTENAILRHYIYVNGQKKEITKEVKENEELKEFEYTITGLTKETSYQIQVEVSDSLDTVRSDILSISTKAYVVYGVRIDENNSNPETCVEYIEDCVGLEPIKMDEYGIGIDEEWRKIFPLNKVRLVGFKEGQITKEIKYENSGEYIDGTTVPSDVDVMVEIPKIYWDFTTINNGEIADIYEIRISDIKFNDTCDCYAHKVKGKEKDFIYVGKYLGYEESGKLRSKKGVTPTKKSMNESRTLAQANGNGYQLYNWYTHLLLQILYLIFFKNLDSQEKIGEGRELNSFRTGESNRFFQGEKHIFTRTVEFLGIEDMWLLEYNSIFLDGAYFKETKTNLVDLYLIEDNSSFSNNIENYTLVYKNVVTTNRYLSIVIHDNKGGFLPSNKRNYNGSISTQYCDYSAISENCFANLSRNDKRSGGIFTISSLSSNRLDNLNQYSRLVYLGE